MTARDLAEELYRSLARPLYWREHVPGAIDHVLDCAFERSWRCDCDGGLTSAVKLVLRERANQIATGLANRIAPEQEDS